MRTVLLEKRSRIERYCTLCMNSLCEHVRPIIQNNCFSYGFHWFYKHFAEISAPKLILWGTKAWKPYKNNTSGCKVDRKAYKTNASEDYPTKNDFSGEHFLLDFIDPGAVLLMYWIIFSCGAKSFAHRTLLYFLQKRKVYQQCVFLSKSVRA